MIAVWIALAVLAAVVLYAIVQYNAFVRLRNRIENAWAQIDVQLQRRYDLIPNVVKTVKGYATHERGVFEGVTEARSRAIGAQGVGEQAQAENMVTSALRSLFAVAEAYPDLQADENFQALQDELARSEDKIAYSRQFYNDTVRAFNTKTQSFPSNVVASAFGFSQRLYFEADLTSRAAIDVQF
ncbi:MAG: LemA family protein [Actinomycetota bacterium]|nr:LemA family protein [Actinomycetota bacterium]MDQ3640987.1 LemA family protein [Actinomycetota bacterium]